MMIRNLDTHDEWTFPCQPWLARHRDDGETERAFTEDHRHAPHYEKWRAAAAELLEPGGQVNTFATPAFPTDLPEAGP